MAILNFIQGYFIKLFASKKIQRKKYLSDKQMIITSVYAKLQYKGVEKLDDETKRELFIEVDHLYPGFKDSIYNLYPQLSGDELLICYLLKAKIRSVNMARLMSKERSTICMKQIRLSKKMFGQEGTTDRLKNYIHSL